MKYFLFQGSGVEKQKGETFCVWPLQLYWNDIITGNIYEHVDLSDNSNRSQVNKEGKVENWREKNKQQNEKKKKSGQERKEKRHRICTRKVKILKTILSFMCKIIFAGGSCHKQWSPTGETWPGKDSGICHETLLIWRLHKKVCQIMLNPTF